VERLRYLGGGLVVRELPIFQVDGGAGGDRTYLLAGRSAVCVSREGHSSSGSVNTIPFGTAYGALVVYCAETAAAPGEADAAGGRLHSGFGRATSTLASKSATSSSSANSEASSSLAASSSPLFSSPAPARR
jgi:hypothetical protein